MQMRPRPATPVGATHAAALIKYFEFMKYWRRQIIPTVYCRTVAWRTSIISLSVATVWIFSRTFYTSSAIGIAIQSVCRLSSATATATLVHPTQLVELFRHIFAPYCSLVYGSVVKKTARKYSQPFPLVFTYKGLWKIRDFRPISRALSRKRYDGHSYKYAISNDLK